MTTFLVYAPAAAGLDGSPSDSRIEDIVVRDYQQKRDVDRLREALSGLMARWPLERQDLEHAVVETKPDVLLIDTNTYGAAVAAERSGLPWATILPSLLPLPDDRVPPYGLGMRPMRGLIGRLRNRVLWRVVERQYGRSMLPRLNSLRADAGLRELRSPLAPPRPRPPDRSQRRAARVSAPRPPRARAARRWADLGSSRRPA
jgi:hypothetical protein